MSLAGARIVIIGGSSGIGLAAAKAATLRGARLVIGGRSPERLARAAAEIGGAVETRALDATDEQAVAALFGSLGRFDHLAVLIPAAPDKSVSAKFAPFLEMEPGLFESVFRNRFWAQLWGVRYGAPRMNPGGSIVLMSSSQPRKTIPRYAASCAAAGAIEALARTLAIELAPIRVNVIAPGFVETPGTEHIPSERRQSWDRITAAQPVKRLGKAEEIASGMMFLMENEYATATVLDVDGGYRLT
jgi:NAD(P)-dependent dehydrogenase (short-subunit alcohol dehydrogenase family)